MILKSDFNRALQRVRKTVAVALLGVPIIERRDGEQVAARYVNTEVADRISYLEALQTKVVGLAQIVGRSLRVVVAGDRGQTRILGIGAVVVPRPVVVGDVLHDTEARIGRRTERVVIIHADLVVARALEHELEVPCLVLDRTAETVHDLRNVGRIVPHVVVGVNHAVIVDILILDITGLHKTTQILFSAQLKGLLL